MFWNEGKLLRYEDLENLPFAKDFPLQKNNVKRKDCNRAIFRGYLYESCFFVGWGCKDIMRKEGDTNLYSRYSSIASEIPFVRYKKLKSLSDQKFNVSTTTNTIHIKFFGKENVFYVSNELPSK